MKAIFLQKVLFEFHGIGVQNIIAKTREIDNEKYNILVMHYMTTLSHLKVYTPTSITQLERIIE